MTTKTDKTLAKNTGSGSIISTDTTTMSKINQLPSHDAGLFLWIKSCLKRKVRAAAKSANALMEVT